LKPTAVAWIASLGAPLVLAVFVFTAYRGPMRTPGGVVLLRAGIGARGVAEELAVTGLVSHPRLFLLFARLEKVDRHLRAGRYAIPPNPSIESLLALLREGPNVRERVTIPEGSRDDQIAGVLARTAGVDSTEFLRIVRDGASPPRYGVPGPTLEGYLFPETYEFPWGTPGAEVVSFLIVQYHKVMIPAFRARAESLGIAEQDVVTLASIIEAETSLPEERPRVSAVYHNRLRAGWNLEADPTVRYATGNDSGEITAGQLEWDSPYNTYRYPGLPPGPIGNPGEASLIAALFPQEGCEDFFFVANGEGGHTFSKTAEEHSRAVAALRRREVARRQPGHS